MSEIKKPVKTFQIDYVCDECRQGKMRSMNISHPTYPPLYPHKCDKCGAQQSFTKMYPTVAIEEKNDER